MTPAHVVEITTPKKFVLNGLWLGPKKPKRVVVWVHGLGSSMFSKLRISELLVDKETAVLAFNNRGHGTISRLVRLNGKKGTLAGAAHEIFKDSVDDVEGAVRLARRSGAKQVFLAGHSTGCQKSIYWASKKGKGVQGIILLAPVSDRSAELMHTDKKALEKAQRVARQLVRQGRKNEFLPRSVWSKYEDAQRFLSLYASDSAEEIFSYGQSKKIPRTLRNVRIPTLVLWAEHDEYSDRPAGEIAAWFAKNLRNEHEIVVVPGVGHSFKGGEKETAQRIANFMKGV